MRFPISLCPCVLIAVAAVSGCAATGDGAAETRHDNTDAVLWVQTSAEYAAAATGVYVSATQALGALEPAERGAAVVFDVDETVLDNSPYQGQLIIDDASYDGESWDRWIAMRSAGAVPGVVEFIRAAQSQGVHIALITNRRCRARADSAAPCPQWEDTRANLEAVGVDTSSITLYLRGQRPPAACAELLTPAERPEGVWSSDKTSRRSCVARDYGIAMLFGDQLGDFVSESSDVHWLDEDAYPWGRRWFMLPNPTYGDWRPRSSIEKRRAIRGIDAQSAE